MLLDPEIDAVAVATPVSTHFRLAMQALEAGKHVLVEKPLALNSEQAAILVEEAERRNLVLMVDHTFVYHGAVQRIRDLVLAGQLGRPRRWPSRPSISSSALCGGSGRSPTDGPACGSSASSKRRRSR